MPLATRHFAALAAAVTAALLCSCAAHDGTTVGAAATAPTATVATTPTLTADSTCKQYLLASKQSQDDAVKRVAVAQDDSVVLTGQGRPQVDYVCGHDDGMTLGGAIGHAAGRTLARSRSRSTLTNRAKPSATVTVVSPVSQRLNDNSIRSTYDSSVAIDPVSFYTDTSEVAFVSPSGNIACRIDEDYGNQAYCQIGTYEFDQPGPDCPLGATVSIEAGGEPSVPTCAPTSLYAPYSTLPYGYSISFGNLACVSASTGISCFDLNTDAGFTMSKEQYSTFG